MTNGSKASKIGVMKAVAFGANPQRSRKTGPPMKIKHGSEITNPRKLVIDTRFCLSRLPKLSHSIKPVRYVSPHTQMYFSGPKGVSTCARPSQKCLVMSRPHLSHKYRSADPGGFANLGNVLAGRSIQKILATLAAETGMCSRHLVEV